jgi:Helix-turn-helix domain
MSAPDARPAPEPGTLAVANAALRAGFVLLPRALLQAPGLSRDAKLLYAVLLSYAWQQGSCFPGYQRLQADLGCGINQVTKYLRELEGAGLAHPAGRRLPAPAGALHRRPPQGRLHGHRHRPPRPGAARRRPSPNAGDLSPPR